MEKLGILKHRPLDILTWGFNMSIYYRKDDATWLEQGAEFFWFTIMYIGFPVITILEWLHWEMYGKGPRKAKHSFK
jgi:hypothetical protein